MRARQNCSLCEEREGGHMKEMHESGNGAN